MVAVTRVLGAFAGAFLAIVGQVFAEETVGPWSVNSIVVERACAEPVWNGGDAVAVYLTIHNLSSDDDHIAAVTSQMADSTAVHDFEVIDGSAQRAILPGGLRIGYREQIAMGRDTTHILLEGLVRAPKQGRMLPLTLILLKAGSLEFEVPLGTCDDRASMARHAGANG